jgi:quinol monooxygenase YgiN
MSAPLIVISRFKVKEGRLEDFKEYYQKIVDIIEANEPQMVAFHGFLNEAGTEMTSIQVHPDTESMDRHMRVLRDNWDESFSQYAQLVQQTAIEYFGTPPASALSLQLQEGVTQTINSQYVAGLTMRRGD